MAMTMAERALASHYWNKQSDLMGKSLQDIAVIIGMPRAGTTWLYENFKNHPDVCVSDHKEINRYLLNISDQHYRKFFCGDLRKINLDISPLYFFDKGALESIAKNHDKVILVTRSPGEWIESLNSQVAKYSGDVEEFVRTGRYVLPVAGGSPVVFDYKSYEHERYINELKQIFNGKLLVLDFSLLQAEPIKTLKIIENYLGIRDHFTANNSILEKVNSSTQPISKLYSLLLRLNILHRLIPIALAILPQRVIHWLRKRFVYGAK